MVNERIKISHAVNGATYGTGRHRFQADTRSARQDINKAATILSQLPDGPVAPEDRAFRSVRLRSGSVLKDLPAAHARKFIEEGRGEYVD